MSAFKFALVPLSAAALALMASPASSAETTFTATLSGSEHVPEAVQTDATGELKFVVSEDGRKVRYVVTVKDILNPAAADVHLGPAGANGPLWSSSSPHEARHPRKARSAACSRKARSTRPT